MLATLTNGKFSVPENPVMRGVAGFGLLQAGNGQAFGNQVDMTGSGGATDMTQTVDANGNLIWTGGAVDGSPYTSDYCNRIILGGTASTVDKFQCSLRGYVGAAGVYAVPPALVPDAPTSVTIPNAIARVTAPRIAPPRSVRRCGQQADAGLDTETLMIGLGVALLAYLALRR